MKFTMKVSGTPTKHRRTTSLLNRHSPRILKRYQGVEFKVKRSPDHDLFNLEETLTIMTFTPLVIMTKLVREIGLTSLETLY